MYCMFYCYEVEIPSAVLRNEIWRRKLLLYTYVGGTIDVRRFSEIFNPPSDEIFEQNFRSEKQVKNVIFAKLSKVTKKKIGSFLHKIFKLHSTWKFPKALCKMISSPQSDLRVTSVENYYLCILYPMKEWKVLFKIQKVKQ